MSAAPAADDMDAQREAMEQHQADAMAVHKEVEGLKRRGNECFVARDYKNAEMFYTQGLERVRVAKPKQPESRLWVSGTAAEGAAAAAAAEAATAEAAAAAAPAEGAAAPTGHGGGGGDGGVHSSYAHVLLANRSATRLHLGRHDAALADAVAALTLRPDWVKAYHRKAIALLALGRSREAQAAYAAALKHEPENKFIRRQVTQLTRALDARPKPAASSPPKAASEGPPAIGPGAAPIKSEAQWAAVFGAIGDPRVRLATMARLWNMSEKTERRSVFTRFLARLRGEAPPTGGGGGGGGGGGRWPSAPTSAAWEAAAGLASRRGGWVECRAQAPPAARAEEWPLPAAA